MLLFIEILKTEIDFSDAFSRFRTVVITNPAQRNEFIQFYRKVLTGMDEKIVTWYPD